MNQGSTSVFAQSGGYRVGRSALLALNFSWPLGSIEISPGQIVLHCVSRRLVFNASARLFWHEGLFSSGIRIEHTVADYPQFVVFWTTDLGALRRHLALAGFQLHESMDLNETEARAAREAQPPDTLPCPSARLIIPFAFVVGIPAFLWVMIAIFLMLRQEFQHTRWERGIARLSAGTSRETVLRVMGSPTSGTPNGNSWWYAQGSSFFELPLTGHYDPICVGFSDQGTVTSAFIWYH